MVMDWLRNTEIAAPKVSEARTHFNGIMPDENEALIREVMERIERRQKGLPERSPFEAFLKFHVMPDDHEARIRRIIQKVESRQRGDHQAGFYNSFAPDPDEWIASTVLRRLERKNELESSSAPKKLVLVLLDSIPRYGR